jgi:uncharacterized protein involved in exopolysaccharide biosynthesis
MEQDDDSEDGRPEVPALDQLKSYLAYGRRALRNHRGLALVIAVSGVLITIAAAVVWPRSYMTSTVLAAKDNKVLDGDRDTGSLRGATEIILSHENVEAIVDEIKLPSRWDQTMGPLQRAKSWLSTKVRGAPSARDKRDALVAVAQNSIYVTPPAWNESKLTVTAEWQDPKVAADLADAAIRSFLRARHVAEISTITEYIGILEGHATQMRDEIQGYLDQSKARREQQLGALTRPAAAAPPPSGPAALAPLRAAPPPRKAEDLGDLRAAISEKQAALKALEETRQRRLADAEATLSGLRTKFTPAHPMVVAAETTLQQIQQDTSKSARLQSEIAALQSDLKSKEAADELQANGGPRVSRVPPSSDTPGAPGIEPLPAEIMRLMQDDGDDLDPAVSAQFRGAVGKYAMLRDKIGTARVDLDTAQAAFRHRYQIVVPAEVPPKPFKPKVPLLLAGGILLALFAGLLAAVIAELRVGRVVERWQVYRLGLPVLGELRWPPESDA